MLIATISHHASDQLAEVGFLLLVIAGLWLAAAQIPFFGLRRMRMIVAGLALSAAGVLLLVAVHWGSFG